MKSLDSGALDRMRRYSWPGNIRELENLARRLAALYPQDVISESTIEAELSHTAPLQSMGPSTVLEPPRASGHNGHGHSAGHEQFSASLDQHVAALFRTFGEGLPPVGLYHRVLRELEAPLIAATLASTRGNQIKAAEVLGLNRNTLRKKIRDLDLRGIRGMK